MNFQASAGNFTDSTQHRICRLRRQVHNFEQQRYKRFCAIHPRLCCYNRDKRQLPLNHLFARACCAEEGGDLPHARHADADAVSRVETNMLLQGQSQSVTDSGRHQADIGEQGARCCSTILSREAAAGVSMARLEDGLEDGWSWG